MREIVVSCDKCNDVFVPEDIVLEVLIRFKNNKDINKAPLAGDFCGAACIKAKITEVMKELRR